MLRELERSGAKKEWLACSAGVARATINNITKRGHGNRKKEDLLAQALGYKDAVALMEKWEDFDKDLDRELIIKDLTIEEFWEKAPPDKRKKAEQFFLVHFLFDRNARRKIESAKRRENIIYVNELAKSDLLPWKTVDAVYKHLDSAGILHSEIAGKSKGKAFVTWEDLDAVLHIGRPSCLK